MFFPLAKLLWGWSQEARWKYDLDFLQFCAWVSPERCKSFVLCSLDWSWEFAGCHGGTYGTSGCWKIFLARETQSFMYFRRWKNRGQFAPLKIPSHMSCDLVKATKFFWFWNLKRCQLLNILEHWKSYFISQNDTLHKIWSQNFEFLHINSHIQFVMWIRKAIKFHNF